MKKILACLGTNESFHISAATKKGADAIFTELLDFEANKDDRRALEMILKSVDSALKIDGLADSIDMSMCFAIPEDVWDNMSEDLKRKLQNMGVINA